MANTGGRVGRLAKVTLGTDKIAEIGSWSCDGISIDMLDDPQFGDEFKTYQMGMGDYGTVSFGGWWDMSDTTGQKILESALNNKSKIIDIRFYVNSVSYYTPNTNAASSGGTTEAGMWVQSMRIGFEKGGIGTIEFTGKLTGPLILI